jgi:hypothetical protein
MRIVRLNDAMAQVIAERIGAQPKACWWNAWRAMEYSRGRYPYVVTQRARQLYYVEGWASFNLPIVEHAWLEHEHADGTITVVDPTPNWCKGGPERVYHGGVRYTYDEVRTLALQHPHEDGSGDPDLPLVWRTSGWGGMEHPDYRAAYARAHQVAYGCSPEELRTRLDRLAKENRL